MIAFIGDLYREINMLGGIILRNYEHISEDIKNGGDIDILCYDRNELTKRVKAVRQGNQIDIYNYTIKVQEGTIPIDVREVGDEYYDCKWEKEMLDGKERYGDFFIMDSENYKYSLLYHMLLHKSTIPLKYLPFLLRNFGTNEKESLIEKLAAFMTKRGYKPTKPLDIRVDFNMNNYENLKLRTV